jgi:hypothetical protein
MFLSHVMSTVYCYNNRINIHGLVKERRTHCNENPIYVFPEKELRASVPFVAFMCLSAIYIFPVSVQIFSCSRIGRPIGGIYKSLTDT